MSGDEATGRGAFSVIAVLVAVIVGVVSFAAFMVLMAFADDLRRPDDGGEHALSNSAIGFAGLVLLMEAEGREVRISRGRLDESLITDEFVILTPPPSHAVPWDDMYSVWGSNLIVLPKWHTRQRMERPDWVDKAGLLSPSEVEWALAELVDGISVVRSPLTGAVTLHDEVTGAETPAGRIEALQTFSGEGIEPLITDQHGNIVLGGIIDYDDDTIMSYVLSDPDLLNTHGIASLQTARAGLTIIDFAADPATPIAFDMTLHGIERTRNMLQLVFVPPFLPAVLCLSFAGVLVTIAAFGPRLRQRTMREVPLGKLTLVDNSARLISLAGRTMHMRDRYIAMIRRQAAHAVGLPAGASETQLTAMLDTISMGRPGSDEANFSQLAANISNASNLTAMVRAMNRLHKWKQELARERGRR
jgi:hypothetical protein